jgi:hypothetical protein
MRQRHLSKIIFLVLILAIVAAGCASFHKTASVTVATSKSLYYEARGAARDLYAQGLIDEDLKAQINEAADIYKAAHNVAQAALEVYTITETKEAKEKLQVAISEAALRWMTVAKLINTIKPGLVPVEIMGD